MAIASLIISIFALLATGTAATVAVVQARTAKIQSKTAMDSLELQREASLVVRVRLVQRTKSLDHDWRVENQGRGHARSVRVFLSFDPQQREYGSISLGDIGPGESAVLNPQKPLQSPMDYTSRAPGGRVVIPTLTIEWKNVDNHSRSEKMTPSIDPGITHEPSSGSASKEK